MLAFLKRYHELLLVAVLLLLPLGTYVANAKQRRELSAFDKLCLAATAPASRAIERALGGIGDLWDGYVALWKVREQNELLRQTVVELRAQLGERLEAEQENERLRMLLDYAAAEEGRWVAARVIGVAPSHRRVISVAVPTGAPVSPGMPVVTGEGVVGKVIERYGSVADVQLLLDPASAIAARVQRSRARLTARGSNGEHLLLANALRSDDLEEGDVVVTSGTDRIFPRGLVIGRIAKLDRKPYGVHVEGEILPAVDVASLEEVLIRVGPGAEGSPLVQTVQPPLLLVPGIP